MSQKLDKWKKHHTGIHLCWDSRKEMQTARCGDDEKESFLSQSLGEEKSGKKSIVVLNLL